MTEQKNTQESPQKIIKKKKGKRYFHYRTFWFLVMVIIGCLVTAVMNWAMNHRDYQEKTAQIIYQKSRTKLEFSDIRFNLFTGEATGKDLYVHVEKINLKLSLKEFTLKYNPFYLWIGKFKITGIYADEIQLDTSKLIPLEKKQKAMAFPSYLKRIHLKEARIARFEWKQPKDAMLKVRNFDLKSHFGSVIYTSPVHALIQDLEYKGPKLDVFVDQLDLDGFLIFDFSQPRIFDETKLSVRVLMQGALLAPHRRPKPWLTDSAWDQDLELLLKKHYPDGIPQNNSYLFVQQALFDVEKTTSNITIKSLQVTVQGSMLWGKGSWNLKSHQIGFELNTREPVSLSKMPLGQAKIRRAFEKFSFQIQTKGQLVNLEQNDVTLSLKAALLNNLVHPEAGDIKLTASGRLRNSVFASDDFTISLDQGSVSAHTQIQLKSLTTNTSFTATNLDVQTVVRLFSSINFPSLANGMGTVTGHLKNPKIDIDLTTPNATYEFLNFGKARANLEIENGEMKFDIDTVDSSVGQGGLNMQVKEVFNPMVQVMNMQSTFENVDVRQLLNAQRMDGKVGGTFNLKREQGIVTAEGHFLVKDFFFLDHKVGFVDATAKIHKKHADIKPLIIELDNPEKTLVSPTGLAFDFDDYGYDFTGTVIEGLKVSGHYEKANKTQVNMKFQVEHLGLDILGTWLPVVPTTSKLSGKADFIYNTKDPWASQLQSQIAEWEIVSPDGTVVLNKPGGFNYKNQAFDFKNFDVTFGKGRFVLNGQLGLPEGSSLKIKGDVDFGLLTDFNPFISESDTPITMDLLLRGNVFKPSIQGTIQLEDDNIKFRKLQAELSQITGTLKFNGNRITTDKLTFSYDDAPMKASGTITTDYEKVTGADLKISGKEVPFYPFEDLSLLMNMDMTLKGYGNMTLAGKMNIVEGRYARDLVITNFLIRPMESSLEEEKDTLGGLPLNTHYDLRIKNTGDMLIQNNLADLELNLDLDMKGTIESPKLMGQMDFLGGEIHALGITFDEASGFAQFNQKSGFFPNITLAARKEIQGYTVTANIDGIADNLRLKLFSSPALDHRDILSLVFYGQTPDQLTEADRRQFTQTAAISQLATILANPLEKYYGLDMVEVTARYDRPQETVQRLTVGKNISDRFGLAFTTDLGSSDPERAFEARYQLFDNFYLIVAKDVVGRSRYRFDVNLRFESY